MGAVSREKPAVQQKIRPQWIRHFLSQTGQNRLKTVKIGGFYKIRTTWFHQFSKKKPNEFLNPGCIMSYRLIICETNFCAGSCADLPHAGGDYVLFIVHQRGR
jgi:hypothetical protein